MICFITITIDVQIHVVLSLSKKVCSDSCVPWFVYKKNFPKFQRIESYGNNSKLHFEVGVGAQLRSTPTQGNPLIEARAIPSSSDDNNQAPPAAGTLFKRRAEFTAMQSDHLTAEQTRCRLAQS